MPHRIFNCKEVATYLHLPVEEVEKLVRKRDIPFEKQGDRIVFHRPDIDGWASRRILQFHEPGLSSYHAHSSRAVKDFSGKHAIMADMVTVDRMQPALPARTTSSVIQEMCALADRTDLVSDPTDLIRSIKEREALCSTAMPGGFALLHPRQHEPYMFVESFLVVGRTAQGIHFGALDGNPTRIFFLVCCQTDKVHLHTLARLCIMCRQTGLVEALASADSAHAMHDSILHAETEIIRLL